MLKTLISISALATLSAPAHAAHLLKAYQSGFTNPHRTATCEVFSDRVIITRMSNGRLLSRRIGYYRWPLMTPRFIGEAKMGTQVGNCNITDVPTMVYSIVDANSSYLLREDCPPAPGIRNLSRSTSELINLLDSLCGRLQ